MANQRGKILITQFNNKFNRHFNFKCFSFLINPKQTDKYLNSDRLKFYILISGELTLNNENDDSLLINVCENLDWKRQYGLHLW